MKKNNPYRTIPSYAHWKKSMLMDPNEVDLQVASPFKLTSDEKIATAGSCFAQHIARHLRAKGFNYFITEPPHELMSDALASEFNYGTYTARFGNIYTTRQLNQLFQRVYGQFAPKEDIWEEGNGTWLDPYRPTIQPGGFKSILEFKVDREQHFKAVRKMFEELDLFVFTLGLTETWVSKEDGAVFPVCPGVSGGEFSLEKYAFKNFDADEVYADMHEFIIHLRKVNPQSKVLLTVSPVPLAATAEDRHVLVSTTYSKSVLRVAAEKLTKTLDKVFYFPSYEVITGNYNRGAYYGEDLRSVKEEGVNNVMRMFFKHFTSVDPNAALHKDIKIRPKATSHEVEMERLIKVNCDEEMLGLQS